VNALNLKNKLEKQVQQAFTVYMTTKLKVIYNHDNIFLQKNIAIDESSRYQRFRQMASHAHDDVCKLDVSWYRSLVCAIAILWIRKNKHDCIHNTVRFTKY
jgi:hypothetical protein